MFKRYFVILSLIVFSGLQVVGQTRISAPNTLFGIGELQGTKNSSMLSLGGASEGLRDPMTVNYSNPASYTAFNPTSFVFEGSISGNYRKQSNDLTSQSHTYGSPGSFLFGFPVSKKLGASFGFQPYSKIGYKIEEEALTDYSTTATYTYDGNGGIDLLYGGFGYKINEHLSVGANAAFSIGKLERNSAVDFNDDTLGLYGITQMASLYPRGFIFTIGAQYEKKLNENLNATFGVTYDPAAKLNVDENVLNVTFVQYANTKNLKDTIAESEVSKKMTIPQKLAVGFSLRDEDKWLLSTSYSYQDWTEYKYDGNSDPHLATQSNFAIAARFTPDKYSLKKLYKRLQYGIGFRYSENYIELKDNPFNEFGISFGLGLPIYKRRAGTSILSFGIEKGQRGSISKNGYKENFTNFAFTIKIYENWFIKHKYD